jgi:rhamnosyltransferase
MPSISVVIRAYNEGAHLPALFKGLDAQTVKPDQVILIDSGSTDDSVAIAKEWGIDTVVPIAKEDFSFGRALNMGFEVATGDLVIIPSAHVFPLYDTWVENLVAPFEDKWVGVSYGRQVGDDRTKYSEQRVMDRWFPRTSIARQDHPFSNNANSCVRRDLWQNHPYDELLTGLEDLDFAKQIMADGFFVSYVAEAPVVHVHEEDFAKVQNRYRREAIAHKKIFEEQELGTSEALMLWSRSIGNDIVNAARDGVLTRKAGSIFQFRTAQFLGTWEGFRQSGPVSRGLKERFYYPDDLSRPLELEAPGLAIDYDA